MADSPRSDLLARTLSEIVSACDLVFSPLIVGMAVVATWLAAVGRASPLVAILVFALLAVNLAWSRVARRHPGIRSDLLRAAFSMPIATCIYIADPGPLAHLWIPALLLSLGPGLSLGIATRSSRLGTALSAFYGVALLVAAAITTGVDVDALEDAIGIAVTGAITSVVASLLGRTLDEARRQRDEAHEQRAVAEATRDELAERTAELTAAIERLHEEMEHRMRVEAELLQAQKLESIGRLAAGVAHEINTPVQFVRDSILFVRTSVTDLFDIVDKLQRGGAAAAAEAIEAADLPYLVERVPLALDRTVDGLDRVTTIVRSLKEFAHPDGKEMAAADLNRAIGSALTMACNEYKYVADLETALGELPPVYCYLGELSQAILNIVVNAAHAIADAVAGTGHRGRIRVTSARDSDDVVIAISDTGRGIPEAIRGQIFTPFFTTKEVGRGTGQGLAMARSVVVDGHHGKLTFETAVGAGTTFTLRIPIDGRRPLALAS